MIIVMLSPTPPGFLDAAKLTVGFSSVYGIAMMLQTVAKQRLIIQKKIVDRYNCPELLNADRLVANLLEWSPMFLGPVWSLAAVGRLDERCCRIAWLYVSLRVIYLVLVVKFGVAKGGRNKPLWGSTLPTTAELHVPHVSLEEISGIDFTMISALRYSFILLLIPPISPVGDRCQASVFSEIEKKLYYKIQIEIIRFEEVYMKLIFSSCLLHMHFIQ